MRFFHLQVRKQSNVRNKQKQITGSALADILVCFYTLKIEAACSSEAMGTCHNVYRSIDMRREHEGVNFAPMQESARSEHMFGMSGCALTDL
jgi:hypothetical protein